MKPLPGYRGCCSNSPSMTLWCIIFPEESRSFQTALAEHLSVKPNHCCCWRTWIRKEYPEEIEGQLKCWWDIQSDYGIRFERMALWERTSWWTCRRNIGISGESWVLKMTCCLNQTEFVVPQLLRREVLDEIHGTHMGESKSISFVRDYVFWPSMTAQIKDKVSSCAMWNKFRNQRQRDIKS